MESNKRPKNWLLLKIREWHTWGGVALSLVIVLVCLTGIYLNHEDWFDGHDHGEHGGKGLGAAAPESSALSAGTDLGTLTIGFSQALALAAIHLGPDAPLEHIQLKDEHGMLVYKVKTPKSPGPEREAIIDVATGAVTLKRKDQYVARMPGGEERLDWGRLMKDLHTGKFFGGEMGRLLVDVTSVVIIVLTVTGIYLWWIPLRRKRESRRQAAEIQARATAKDAR